MILEPPTRRSKHLEIHTRWLISHAASIVDTLNVHLCVHLPGRFPNSAVGRSEMKITSINAGSSHSLALVQTDDGKTIVLSWGVGEDGQLGHGDADQTVGVA